MDETVGRSKVKRVIRDYELEGLSDRLEEYWTREEDRYSLRELADHFNKQVLQAAMDDAGVHPLDGEVENTYQLLTGSDVSQGSRRQAERTLERENIVVSELTSDFVTHQAVHTYLRKHRGVSLDNQRTVGERQEAARETIERLRSRTEAVTKNTLENISLSGQPADEEFDVVVDIRIVDTESGQTVDVEEFFGDNFSEE